MAYALVGAGGNDIVSAAGTEGERVESNRMPQVWRLISIMVLWLLGLITSYTIGGFIHILLVIAVVMVLINLISGRRAL